MSQSWGSLSVDGGARSGPIDTPASKWVGYSKSEGSEEPDERMGAWPEEMGEISFYADSAFTLPGMSDRGDGCGEWYPKQFCEECGEVYLGEERCRERGCPVCWKGWRRDRAESMTARLAAGSYDRAGVDDETEYGNRLVHAVASPPEGSIQSIEQVYSGFRDAYEMFDKQGVRGGVVIFHGYRVKEEPKRLWRELKEAGEVSGGLWKWIREHERGWRELTYWSPHYHCIGLSTQFEENKPGQQDGWVVERIRSVDSLFGVSDSGPYDDIVGLSLYVLSHVSFEVGEQRDVVRWFGELSTSKFSPEGRLSEGAWDTIRRKAAEAVSVDREGGDEGESESEPEECAECGSTALSSIFEAGSALQDDRWCERIGPEKEKWLRVAFEWRIGDIQPPPGRRCPRSRSEAQAELEAFVDAY